MSQHERQLKQTIELYMDEQRRLHREVMGAVVDTKVAAAEARVAAETVQKASADMAKWTLSVQKRVEKLERWQAGLIGAGFVAGAALWDKAKKVLGLA